MMRCPPSGKPAAMTPAMMFDGKLAKVVNEKHGKPTQV
jgi:hypothetical protein